MPMATWKLILLANRARRGWGRIPPEQRAAIMRAAEQAARKHGPVVAKTMREQGPQPASHDLVIVDDQHADGVLGLTRQPADPAGSLRPALAR